MKKSKYIIYSALILFIYGCDVKKLSNNSSDIDTPSKVENKNDKNLAPSSIDSKPASIDSKEATKITPKSESDEKYEKFKEDNKNSISCPPDTELAKGNRYSIYELFCAKKTEDGSYVRNGPYIMWTDKLPNIKLMSGIYKNGKKEGEWSYFSILGYTQSKGYFMGNNLEGKWLVYYSDGGIACEGNFSSGDGFLDCDMGGDILEVKIIKNNMQNEWTTYPKDEFGTINRKKPLEVSHTKMFDLIIYDYDTNEAYDLNRK